MSDLSDAPVVTPCRSGASPGPCFEPLPVRTSELAPGFAVRRALPARGRRLVGPWCFLDRMGPVERALDVAPHPHIGLQTVTWLLEGELLHRDSLGSEQVIRPGQLNLMTSGRGIAHSEESPPGGGRLHGVQLWIALPEAERRREPSFEHHAALPRLDLGGAVAAVFAGAVGDFASPARVFTATLGVEIRGTRGGRFALPLEPAHEHAVLLLEGRASLEGQALSQEALGYLGSGRDALEGELSEGARLVLVGGAPSGEEILMWWNFVARTPEEIAAAREDWAERRAFGEVPGYPGARLAAPPLSGRFRTA